MHKITLIYTQYYSVTYTQLSALSPQVSDISNISALKSLISKEASKHSELISLQGRDGPFSLYARFLCVHSVHSRAYLVNPS